MEHDKQLELNDLPYIRHKLKVEKGMLQFLLFSQQIFMFLLEDQLPQLIIILVKNKYSNLL